MGVDTAVSVIVPPHVTPWLFLAGAVIVLFLYVFRVFKGAFNYFSSANSKVFLTDRREFVSKIALGLAAIPFASIIFSMKIFLIQKK